MLVPPLILASASSRRSELLRSLGIRFRTVPPDVDEAARPGEAPEEHALRLAETKARTVAAHRPLDRDAVVLGADTVVALDGIVLGKPSDEADARRMLRLLAGRTHEVFTGVSVCRTGDGRRAGSVERTVVRFRPLDETILSWYVSTGECADKAGAYSIQGQGVLLTDGIQGSWSNVVGLPLEALPSLLARVGIDLRELVISGSGA